MKFTQRVQQLSPYLFVEISRRIAAKKAEGKRVVSFGIGDPDLATPDPILERLAEASHDRPNHRYPETEGLPEFREAVAGWYEKRFGVGLDAKTEVLSLIGAKEGIGHIALGLLEPGDVALQPDPSYPVYNVGTLFAGAEPYWMPLNEEGGWLPDLDAIPAGVAEKAQVMWLNYPNNPTGAVADLDFFDRAVSYCKRNDIALLHDACYTEVAFDGYKPVSALEIPGAKDICLEFHSLSKSYNMTGWRVGMAVGNADLVRALFLVKSNLDSGVSQAVQQMGIRAMETPQSYLDERNAHYQTRRDKVISALNGLGLNVEPPKASLYVWAPVPAGFTASSFATAILDELDMVVTPGTGYGKFGEGYIRLSLTLSDEDLEEGVRRLETWKVPTAG